MGKLSEEKHRLAAIMFTDMVGYTGLGQRNESLSLALVKEQRKLIRPILVRHNGTEVKTMGDAFLVEFPNAMDAVRCAYDIQRASREFNISQPDDRRIRLRIGLHLGDIEKSQGDILGDAVNVASRMEPLAEEGGVCLTRQVYDQVRSRFELPLTSLGVRSLKNVETPMEVYKIEMPWESERSKPPPQLDAKRIAVLPFTNMSPDPNDEYFTDGMTDEVISTISKINEVEVISRTSVMLYKKTPKSIKELSKELDVGTVLEGSVRKAGNKLRVTVQMIDAFRDRHLWANSYDREIQDVFAIQSDIAERVAEALKVKLLANETSRIRKTPTQNMDAYLLYLKGKQQWNKRSREDVAKAIECFKQAIDQDSNFALAYAGLADSYWISYVDNFATRADLAEKWRLAALKALELDGNLAEAHTAYADVLALYDLNLDAAGAEFRKAIELNTNYAFAHNQYSLLLRDQGLFDESLAEAKKGLELDPITPLMSGRVGGALYTLERYDEAMEYFKRSLALEPNYRPALEMLAKTYSQKGEFAEALMWWEKWARFVSKEMAMVGLALIKAMEGERDEALRSLDLAMKLSESGKIRSDSLALVYAALHDEDRMFELLERALGEEHILVSWVRADPLLKEWRSNPRFLEILKKLGLEIS